MTINKDKTNIVNTIKGDILVARKNRDKTKVSFLSTLLSEIEMTAKNDGNRPAGDNDAVRVIKKFVKNTEEVIGYSRNGDCTKEVAEQELDILNSYLPKQLSEDEIRHVVSTIVNNGASNMGMVMKELKNRDDIDKKLASSIAKEFF